MAVTAGEAVTLVVPGDRLRIGDAPAGANAIAARAATVEFVGSAVTVFLETDGGVELQVQRPLHDLGTATPEVGQPMVAHWAPEHGFLVTN
ncbi:MAG TPA: TOBE domain-containing protein [Hansschlegelia sp.]